MKVKRVLATLLAVLIAVSVSFAAAPAGVAATTTQEITQGDNAQIMEENLAEFIRKNDIDKEHLSFAYYDFNRELRYVYQGDRLFPSHDAFKFPLAYLYFKDLVSGKHHLNEDVGEDNLRTVFLRSLTKDYGHDANATKLLIEKYGGIKAVKQAMYELTYTKVPENFYNNSYLTANYSIDFLVKYYSEAMYCSADFKHMLIDPIKQFSPERFSETNIVDYKVTHRYGISKSRGVCVDMGIVNSSNPFAFVIAVDESEHPEEDIALLAEFANDFNEQYGSLLLSQMTTLPDVPDEDKKGYDFTKVTGTPIMITVIVVTVLIAAGVTTAYIIHENKKKDRDRMD